jgi:hypothetical protein
MTYLKLIGKRVKYYAAVKYNGGFNKLYAGEELVIRGVDVDKKHLVLENRLGEIWKLYPNDVRYLNNQKVKIY